MTLTLHPTDGARHTGLRARDHITGFSIQLKCRNTQPLLGLIFFFSVCFCGSLRLIKLRPAVNVRCSQQAGSFSPSEPGSQSTQSEADARAVTALTARRTWTHDTTH